MMDTVFGIRPKSLEFTARLAILKETQIILKTNPFLKQTLEEGVSRPVVAQYLHNRLFIFTQMSELLSFAAWQSHQCGWLELNQFFEQKRLEEVNRDRWDLSDLHPISLKEESHLSITPETQEVISYVRRIIQEDARLYLGFQVFLEYFSALIAPSVLSALDRFCGISKEQISVLASREIVDHDSIEKEFRSIAYFVDLTGMEDRLLEVIHDTAQRVSKYFTSCLAQLH